jgi:tRNA-dihydrouridine synthase 3
MFSLNAHRCRFTHDIPKYLDAKPADIHIRETNEIVDIVPFVTDGPSETDGHSSSMHSSIKCPIFEETGECR